MNIQLLKQNKILKSIALRKNISKCPPRQLLTPKPTFEKTNKTWIYAPTQDASHQDDMKHF